MGSEPRKELSQWDKGRIEGRSISTTGREIGHELHIPHQTVSSFLTRLKTRNSSENLSRSGRPRITTKAQDKRIVNAAETNTRLPFASLQNIVNVPASTSTIRRRLREDLIRKWRAVKRTLLTKERAKKRLDWALKYQHYTREDWAKIAWSDESAIQKDSARQQAWVFRHQNKEEKYAPQNIRGKARDGDIYQMVWGCFVGNKLGPIVSIDGSITGDVYIALLRDNFLPYLDVLASDDITDIMLQQDNARAHTCNKAKAFFNIAMVEHGFTVMDDWPPYSPDMNLIENLWAHLKLELHRQYPDTAILSGSPQYIRQRIAERVHTVWWSIGEEVLDRLIDSMRDRVHALIKARGWYTKY